MKTYLMLFSIGPVQEFIAQARKTRDLWFGSHVLSEISKEAAQTLVQHYRATMIFPYLTPEMLDEKLDHLKVANKVVAVVQHDNPREVAYRTRQAVARKWLTYADAAKEQIKEYVITPMWDRQVKDFIELYAVWYELKEDDFYADVLVQSEQLMSARKTLRDFKPNEPADLFGDIKSSLDGGRESVLRTQTHSGYRKLGIKRNEYLDAISLVKRLSHKVKSEESKHFSSVCEVAFRQFTSELASDPKRLKKAESYFLEVKSILSSTGIEVSELTSLESSYDFFYPNRIEEKLVELPLQGDNDGLLDEQVYSELTDRISELLSTIQVTPTPYYALLVGDGDRMGQCLRGMKQIEEHQQFTRELSAFATKVDEIVQQDYSGQMIYSGGDDVMAVLPIHHCLQAARKIQQAFVERMGQAVSGDLPRPTFSIGIAIVHMVEPMEEALQLARNSEKLAKERRNEIAIHFKKRSGSDELKISLPFDGDPVQDILQFQELFREGYLSSSFAYELRKLHLEYHGLMLKAEALTGSNLQDIIEQELRRVLLKKKPSHVSAEVTTGYVYEQILNIFKGAPTDEPEQTASVVRRLNRLAEQCILALTLVKEGDLDGTNHQNSAT